MLKLENNNTVPTIDLSNPLASMLKPTTDLSNPLASMLKPTADVSNPLTSMLKPTTDILNPLANMLKTTNELYSPDVTVMQIQQMYNPTYNYENQVFNLMNPFVSYLTSKYCLALPMIKAVKSIGNIVDSIRADYPIKSLVDCKYVLTNPDFLIQNLPHIINLVSAINEIRGMSSGVDSQLLNDNEMPENSTLPDGTNIGNAEDYMSLVASSFIGENMKDDIISLTDETVIGNQEDFKSLTIPDYTEENAKQDEQIQKVELWEEKVETTAEKGNFGEMAVDQDLRDKGYERVSDDIVTQLRESGHQGIDGVYHNEIGVPQYIIVESKYGTSELNPNTADGKQMSEKWIDNRLDKAVGKENADEIRMEKLTNPDNVGTYVARVDQYGVPTYDKLDSNANVVEKDVKFDA